MATDYTNLPDFDSLPKVKGMPQGCAWGIFDKGGKKDHLGCVNLLTPAVVKDAYKEAKDGVSVSLNWPIGAINKPGFMRVSLPDLKHTYKHLAWQFWMVSQDLEAKIVQFPSHSHTKHPTGSPLCF